ncbi:MAG: magnesium chelatase, partial [Saprospiraceae bacterium]|nr:magnesium chelatase [Saprospiraceae bacterium]
DVQIRGFKLRLPLDIQFLFTANPEDYTNRGSIITPLKDRIESQILTHYPEEIEIARQITKQEARISEDQRKRIEIPEIMEILLEQISFEARESEYIDDRSGVSARLSISGFENLVSAAERRMLINNEKKTCVRITDFWGVVPAITGKVELVYEGEQEGPYAVAIALLGAAIKNVFLDYFPSPDDADPEGRDPYGTIRAWFSGGNTIDLLNDATDKDFAAALQEVAGLEKLVKGIKKIPKGQERTFMELALHGLAEFNVINKDFLDSTFSFRDLLADMLDDDDIFDEDDY